MANIRVSKQAETECSTDNLLVAGDYYPRHTSAEPLISRDIQKLVTQSDGAIVNLEAPIHTKTPPISKYGPALSLTGDSIDKVSEMGFTGATLANNHIMDYGGAGLRRTITRLESNNAGWVGAGGNRKEAFTPMTVTTANHDVCIVNAADREFGTAGKSEPGYAWLGDDLLGELRDQTKESDITVLILHGGIEYEPIPAAQRRERYQRLADTGVDVILGHHPHVPKGWEVHEGTPICYSLGHFLFDFDRKSRKPKTEWGLLANIRIESGSVKEVVLVPVRQHQDHPRVRLLGENKSRDQYLSVCQDVLNSRSKFHGLWQELAITRYEEYYGKRLRGTVRSTVFDSAQRFRWLQNSSQCESHRWCIQTATKVLGETTCDVRSKESAQLLASLRKQTRDTDVEKALRKVPTLSRWYESMKSGT